MTLGEKIYRNRTRLNLSQGDLAEKLDVSRQSVSKWENDMALPDLDKIVKLSEIFGLSIDEFVKGEAETQKNVVKAETQSAKTEKQSAFPPRKIIGTVLLSLSVLIMFIFFALGGIEGALAGFLLSSPLILCGIICFIFMKNVGLWCSWAALFCFDMYLRVATGTNPSVILNFQTLLYIIRGSEFLRLLFAFAQLAAIVSLIFITALRFRKIPLESKKTAMVFWAVYAALKIAMAVFSASHLYRQVMNYVLSTLNTGIYVLLHSLYVWIYTGFFVAALVFTARYFYTKKQK